MKDKILEFFSILFVGVLVLTLAAGVLFLMQDCNEKGGVMVKNLWGAPECVVPR